MRLFFISSPKPTVATEVASLIEAYGQSDFEDADCVVAVGGDGAVLKALHSVIDDRPRPVYAMRGEGSVGFLGNPLDHNGLIDRIAAAVRVNLHPLRIEMEMEDRSRSTAYAINEITLLRQTRQSSWLRLTINGVERAAKLVGDGVIVSTPAGSTAYNRSAGGPILPLDSRLLAITGLATFPGAEWSNAVVRDTSIIEVEVLQPSHRPVKLETDASDYVGIRRAVISTDADRRLTLLFDAKANLEADRICVQSDKRWTKE